MASFVLVRHKVRNFSEWKRGYDAHAPNRTEAGLTERQLFQVAGDPNEVVIIFETKDHGRAKAFVESVDLRETMHKVGVVDKPDVYFLVG
jgi:hypothetical protein